MNISVQISEFWCIFMSFVYAIGYFPDVCWTWTSLHSDNSTIKIVSLPESGPQTARCTIMSFNVRNKLNILLYTYFTFLSGIKSSKIRKD